MVQGRVSVRTNAVVPIAPRTQFQWDFSAVNTIASEIYAQYGSNMFQIEHKMVKEELMYYFKNLSKGCTHSEGRKKLS